MKKYLTVFSIVLLISSASFADEFTNLLELVDYAVACMGEYSGLQSSRIDTNVPINFTVIKDPADYFSARDFEEDCLNAGTMGRRTSMRLFRGICFDYALEAYNSIDYLYKSGNRQISEYYIATCDNDPNLITLYDPVETSNYHLNGVPVKEAKTVKVKAHGDTRCHAWLWVKNRHGTWYWIDPTWTDNTGYTWFGAVQKKVEVLYKPNFISKHLPSPPPYETSTPSSTTSTAYEPSNNYLSGFGSTSIIASANFVFGKDIIFFMKDRELKTWGVSLSSNVLLNRFCVPMTLGTVLHQNGISLFGGAGLGFYAGPVIVYGLADVGSEILGNETIKDKMLFGGGSGVMFYVNKCVFSGEVHWTTKTGLFFQVGIGILYTKL